MEPSRQGFRSSCSCSRPGTRAEPEITKKNHLYIGSATIFVLNPVWANIFFPGEEENLKIPTPDRAPSGYYNYTYIALLLNIYIYTQHPSTFQRFPALQQPRTRVSFLFSGSDIRRSRFQLSIKDVIDSHDDTCCTEETFECGVPLCSAPAEYTEHASPCGETAAAA